MENLDVVGSREFDEVEFVFLIWWNIDDSLGREE